MSMMFSQNVGFTGKISRRPLPMLGVVSGPLSIPLPVLSADRSPAPQQQQQIRQRAIAASVASTSRAAAASAPRSIKQLFNLGHIMANPGMPCKACGS